MFMMEKFFQVNKVFYKNAVIVIFFSAKHKQFLSNSMCYLQRNHIHNTQPKWNWQLTQRKFNLCSATAFSFGINEWQSFPTHTQTSNLQWVSVDIYSNESEGDKLIFIYYLEKIYYTRFCLPRKTLAYSWFYMMLFFRKLRHAEGRLNTIIIICVREIRC